MKAVILEKIGDIKQAFVDSVKREEGFVKSVIYLENYPKK